jgi:putative flippase GtrA
LTSRMAKLPRGQLIRYLIAGAGNTAFGYGVFAGLYHSLHTRIHYMILAIISNIISITVAYVNYKFFVFKTKGNYLREYLRFYVVYGASIVMSLTLLPFFIEIVHVNPYAAQAMVTFITVSISFFAHRNYSFKR